jgi:hypothetical protein
MKIAWIISGDLAISLQWSASNSHVSDNPVLYVFHAVLANVVFGDHMPYNIFI